MKFAVVVAWGVICAIIAHGIIGIAQRVRARWAELVILQGIMTVACLLQDHEPPITMISSSAYVTPAVRGNDVRLFRGVAMVFAACALSASLWAQTATTPAAAPAAAPAADNPSAADNTNAAGRMRRGNQNGNGGNFDPAAMQARMMSNLRDQFGVTDDAEWNLIAERITAVSDLRRSAMGGAFAAMRGGGNRPNRPGATANPEVDALRIAVTDKLPDAEVKARLEHLREVRKQNEAKLQKAQEDLRAVLTVRQEAVAVMAGLLP